MFCVVLLFPQVCNLWRMNMSEENLWSLHSWSLEFSSTLDLLWTSSRPAFHSPLNACTIEFKLWKTQGLSGLGNLKYQLVVTKHRGWIRGVAISTIKTLMAQDLCLYLSAGEIFNWRKTSSTFTLWVLFRLLLLLLLLRGWVSFTMLQISCSQPCFSCTQFVKQWWVRWTIDYFPIRTSLTSLIFMIGSFRYFLYSKQWVNYIALIFWKYNSEDQAPLICFEDDWRSREVNAMLYISFNVSDWLFSFYKWVDHFVKLHM